MARAIDGDELLGIERLLDTDVVRQSKTASWLLDQVLHDIQAMPTLTPQNEWVSVDKRLPDEELKRIKELFPGENEVEVLVMIQGAYTATTLYWDGEKFYDEMSSYEVTHWMPLPAPPDRRPPEGNCEIKDYAETCDECGFCGNTPTTPPEGEDA